MQTSTTEIYSHNSDHLTWEVSKIAEHFHVTCIDLESNLGGSGFARSKETAQKKALSELNERLLFTQFKSRRKLRAAWALDLDDSCSGFAVGYSKSKTVLRAILEGCERWALSKWIDDGFALEEVRSPIESDVVSSISSFFLTCSHYKLELPIIVDQNIIKIQVVVTLGWSEEGVFAGYGSKMLYQEALEHSYVEALRNFLIYKNQPARDYFPYDRIAFFAKNKGRAIEVLKKTHTKEWSTPQLGFLNIEQFGEIWLARAIFDGWKPWQLGDSERFLY